MLPMSFEPIPRLDLDQPDRALWLPAWLQRCVSALPAGCLNPTIPAELALNQQQRRAVLVRVNELEEAETACDVDHTVAAVLEMLEAFPSANLSDAQARNKMKGYMTALEDVPTWAVVEACRRWLRARAGDQKYDYAPSPPRLRKIADEVLFAFRAQLHFLQQLLKAKPVSEVKQDPEMRQRINEGFAQLCARLKMKADDRRN